MSCLSDIKKWMSKNFLQLNDWKSDVVISTHGGPVLGALIISPLVWVPCLIMFKNKPTTRGLFLILICPLMLKRCSSALLNWDSYPVSAHSFLLQTQKRSAMLSSLLGFTISIHFILVSANRSLLMVPKSWLVSKGDWAHQGDCLSGGNLSFANLREKLVPLLWLKG